MRENWIAGCLSFPAWALEVVGLAALVVAVVTFVALGAELWRQRRERLGR